MNEVFMEKDTFLTEMKTVPIFQQMADEDLVAISEFSNIFSYDKGEEVIKEATMNSDFFVLFSGAVEVVKTSEEKDIRIAVLKSPSFFGETSLFKNELTTANVKTLEPTTILVISREQFSAFINSHHKAGLIILTYISFGLLQKLKTTNDELVETKNLEFSESDISVLKSIFAATDE
ncbi:MAG: cyclic nucleotide-binding protein [Treponema sp.]|nr:MAG: cyclic nucleotide-binding protein [Treponema sp.]